MLNERTVGPTAVSQPPEPAATDFPSHALRQLADLLDRVPGLSKLYITMSGSRGVGLQLPSHEATEPQERFPAVARLAQAIGTDTALRPWGRGSWCFEADGAVGALRVHVYAPLADVAVAPAASVGPENA